MYNTIEAKGIKAGDFRRSTRNAHLVVDLERSLVGGKATGVYPVCRWFEPIRSNFSVVKKLLTSYIFTKRPVEIWGVLAYNKNI